MLILAIDPGPEQSAMVFYRPSDGDLGDREILPNNEIILGIRHKFYSANTILVIEQIASFGMAVGASVFETVFWSGMFAEAWDSQAGKWDRIKRHEVKMHLCGSMRAKDANIRQALIDKLGEPGTKKNPGKTYGISKDLWSALAIAVTYAETRTNLI